MIDVWIVAFREYNLQFNHIKDPIPKCSDCDLLTANEIVQYYLSLGLMLGQDVRQ